MKFVIYEFQGENPPQIPSGKYWLIDEVEVNQILSLCQRQLQAICAAIEYQKQNGNPVDKLYEILLEIIDDEEAWNDIVDDNYSR